MTIQLFDKTELLVNLDDDGELVQSILDEAATEIPNDIEKLRDACGSGDPQSVRIRAHTIKGMAANLCTPALRDVCMKIENAGRDGDMEAARGLLPELEHTARLTLEAIKL